MKREDLIKCFYVGYNETLNDCRETLPITGVESQYAWEFGSMMAVEGFLILESEYDEYLDQILFDSASEYKLSDLI